MVGTDDQSKHAQLKKAWIKKIKGVDKTNGVE